MHYYQFNIADYRKDTAHLTPIEHYIYRQLIDWYYLDEKEIPKKTQSVLRRLQLGSESMGNLTNVLEDFFEETENGWAHKRIDDEIEAYHAKAVRNKINGGKGGRPKKQASQADSKPKKTQLVSSENPKQSENNPNQEPLTNNHKPITSNQEKDIAPQAAKPSASKKPALDYSSWPELPEDQIFDDWHAMRKRLKAPVSQTVVDNFGRDLHKAVAAGFTVNQALAECVTRSWKGLKVEWLQNANGQARGGSRPPPAANVSYTSADYSRGINPDGSF